ncbi:MAG: DUF1761 domain-containing protein [Phenylobacterium sp.]|uniref:DUF1761 domain-containing protein n=1 Tax=Phenylobacterium sp. TaxID=1871053 RepID=UPI001B7554BB|nr:DUF1761 domain-containing protein [Phenylobacterium sp.]MBP7814565.1 DUF1761 domain-containing protein [Phenylobacterium sp.]MBP9232815.1 DUF1761 domain-containing protein [Phenylobacterium sp.]MBP9753678.1 DUF1761 domain-containing protein [Phenylobacterium sp.]
MFKNINWIAVIIAVVLLEVLGFLWYGPVLGEAWSVAYRDSIGRDPDMSNLVVTQSLGVVNTLILVFGLAWVFARLGVNSLAGIGTAVAAWFFFNFTTMAIEYIYMGLAPNLVIINMGYQLLAYLVAGAVLGLMPGSARDS